MCIKSEQHNEDMARLRAEKDAEIEKLKAQFKERTAKHDDFMNRYLHGNWQMANRKWSI